MRILLVLSIIAGLAGSAFAASEADRGAVQSTIARQLDAFLADDAATAYSFAAPNITARFRTPDIFIDMVRQAYSPVYRWRSRQFAELADTATGVKQVVDIVDAAGEYWTATYMLERQPDGSWKITACYLEKKPGTIA